MGILNALMQRLGLGHSPAPQMQQRRYDAASQSSRTQKWQAPSTDGTAAIYNAQTIRNRARDLVRNNPWAHKSVEVIVNNTIGYGIRVQWHAKNKSAADAAQALWKRWAESTQCDAAGQLNIYGLQALAMRTLVESGECLIRLRPRRAADGLAVPMQIQILEPDYLYTGKDGTLKGGGIISAGIEFDASGQRVAYYLYTNHPGAAIMPSGGTTYSRVPVAEVIHLYRKDRSGQERGVSWLAPAMITLRELDIYEDAYLKRQQIANLHAAFITTEDDIDSEQEAYTSLANGLLPGSIYLMRPNRSVQFNDPPNAGDYGPFTNSTLRRVAAALGITFESLTGNLSEVNFSSARMGWQEMGRNIDAWRWNLFVPQFCTGVAYWFADFAGIDAAPDWTAPSRMMVDPAREVPAIRDAIRAGLLTLSEAQRQQGYDPQQLIDEYQADLNRLTAQGIVIDSDARNALKATGTP